jgi:hypothetical protein
LNVCFDHRCNWVLWNQCNISVSPWISFVRVIDAISIIIVWWTIRLEGLIVSALVRGLVRDLFKHWLFSVIGAFSSLERTACQVLKGVVLGADRSRSVGCTTTRQL